MGQKEREMSREQHYRRTDGQTDTNTGIRIRNENNNVILIREKGQCLDFQIVAIE